MSNFRCDQHLVDAVWWEGQCEKATTEGLTGGATGEVTGGATGRSVKWDGRRMGVQSEYPVSAATHTGTHYTALHVQPASAARLARCPSPGRELSQKGSSAQSQWSGHPRSPPAHKGLLHQRSIHTAGYRPAAIFGAEAFGARGILESESGIVTEKSRWDGRRCRGRHTHQEATHAATPTRGH